MDWTNEHYLWASMIWGSVAGGYLVYGWRQKAAIPLAAGAIMTIVAIFLPALWMTVISLAIILAVWWLSKEGF